MLAELPVMVIDCQSTGATPDHGALLELGWARAEGPAQSSLVALPPGESISRQVTRITGLRSRDLEHAPAPDDVWRRFERALDELPRPVPAVIHFATFEERWLRHLHATHRPDEPFPFRIVCTHSVARRLLPELPRRGLRALAGYFGANVGRMRRSADHVRATQHVWRELTARLADRGVRDLDGLDAWIARTPAGKARARGFPMPESERADLPKAPGVYRMRRVDGSILYIGKARCLRKRVRSYFHKRTKIPDRTLEMLSQARRLDWTETETPLEAALLEQELIKDRAPPYNVALRHDTRDGDARQCWFADRDLASFVDAADDAHPVGPVIDRGLLEGLGALANALAGAPVERAVLGRMAPWGPDDDVLEAGLAEVRQRHPDTEPTLRGLLGLGRALWPIEGPGPIEEPEADDEEEAPREGWTPVEVADFVEERWARAAHAIRHARWLAVLSEASVAWTVGDRRRVLVLEEGRVAQRDWLEPGATPPCPRGHARRMHERRPALDVRTRDRLRVLTTELRRVLAEGGEPVVRTGPSSMVRPEALARLFALV